MNVNILNTNNPYINKFDRLSQLNRERKEISKSASNPITSNEVQYFKKMFPLNADQIDNYISFNRHGNVTNVNNDKGVIVDNLV